MYFDEGRIVKQLPQSDISNRRNQEPAATSQESSKSRRKSEPALSTSREVSSSSELKIASILDSANNKLQELMQILYLLSRDPAVPKDARYHVTVAQGEIALLARVIRNTTEESGEKLSGIQNLSFRPAHL